MAQVPVNQDPPEVVDLHPSEWKRENEKWPFWGIGAYPFLVYTVCGLIGYALMSVTVAPFLGWLLR